MPRRKSARPCGDPLKYKRLGNQMANDKYQALMRSYLKEPKLGLDNGNRTHCLGVWIQYDSDGCVQ